MHDICLALLAFILSTGAFEDPGDCPRVEAVERRVLQHLACDGKACPVQAFYRYGGGVLYMDRSLPLDDLWTRGILLHELVHYLQERAGRTGDTSCRAGGLRELEAFRIQERFLLAHGIRAPVSHNIRFYVCGGS